MSRSAHLSELQREFVALGAKPSHIRRLWRAWLGRAPWTAEEHASYPAGLARELPQIRGRLESLARFDLQESALSQESGKLLVMLPLLQKPLQTRLLQMQRQKQSKLYKQKLRH